MVLRVPGRAAVSRAWTQAAGVRPCGLGGRDRHPLDGRCASCSVCCSWSTATAKMMTAPLMTCCQNDDTPTMTRPSARKPMTNAPMRVPRIVPRPPESAAPPMTTAAMAFSSYDVAGGRGCRRRAPRQQQADDRGAEPGDDVDADLDPLDRDAGQLRGALVAARWRTASGRRRAVQHQRWTRDRERPPSPHGDRDARAAAPPSTVEAGVAEPGLAAEVGVGRAVGASAARCRGRRRACRAWR